MKKSGICFRLSILLTALMLSLTLFVPITIKRFMVGMAPQVFVGSIWPSHPALAFMGLGAIIRFAVWV